MGVRGFLVEDVISEAHCIVVPVIHVQLEDRPEGVKDIDVVDPHVVEGDAFSLLEAYPLMQIVPFSLEKVNKLNSRPFCFIRVVKHHVHDIPDHLIFLVIRSANSHILIAKLFSLILRVVRIEPDPNLPVLVNHHLLLRYIKSPNLTVKFLISFEHGHRAVEIIGEGDVLVLAQP